MASKALSACGASILPSGRNGKRMTVSSIGLFGV
jgi:hypothetical protein